MQIAVVNAAGGAASTAATTTAGSTATSGSMGEGADRLGDRDRSRAVSPSPLGRLLGGVNISVSGTHSKSPAAGAGPPSAMPTSLRSLKAKLARSMKAVGGGTGTGGGPGLAGAAPPPTMDMELLAETIGEIRTLWRAKEQRQQAGAGSGSSSGSGTSSGTNSGGGGGTFWQHFSSLSATEEASRLLQWLATDVRVLQVRPV